MGWDSIQSWLAHLGLVAKRLVVLLSAVFTVYLAVGSWLYGLWFFDLLWRGRFWQINYWLRGLNYQILNHTYWIIFVIVVFFVLVVLLSRYRGYVFTRIDRFAWWLVLAFSCTIVITALLVYKQNLGLSSALDTLDGIAATSEEDLRVIESQGALSVPEAPVDFKYIDRARVEGLYSQLEPEMVEKQRTLQGETEVGGKAGIAAGAANAEIGVAKQSGATSSFQRVDFSPERKCVELMKFLVDKKTANYYSERSSWVLKKSVGEIRKEMEHRQREPITLESIEKLRMPIELPLGNTPTKADQERSDRQDKENDLTLSAELRSLTGLVFVGGEFSVSRGPGEELVLTRMFASKPMPITFRMTIPTTEGLADIREAKVYKGTVLGSVIRPLTDAGIVEVRALAVY